MLQNDTKIAKILFIISVVSFLGAISLYFYGQDDDLKRLKYSESLNLKSDKLRIVEFYNPINQVSKEFSEMIDADTNFRKFIVDNFEIIRIKSNDNSEKKLFEDKHGTMDFQFHLILDKYGRIIQYLYPNVSKTILQAMLTQTLKMNFIFEDDLQLATQKSKVNGKFTLVLVSEHIIHNLELYDLLNKEVVKSYIDQNFNLTSLHTNFKDDNVRFEEFKAKNTSIDWEVNEENGSRIGIFLILDTNQNLISTIKYNSEIRDKNGDKFLNKLNSIVNQ